MPNSAPASSHESLVVLIVDDDELTTKHFAEILRREGYTVRTALGAETALGHASASALAAIVLDLHMPLVDGLGFLQQLRATGAHQHTPVVIVTGDYLIDDKTCDELKKTGVELRFKPLWVDDLVEIVRTMVGRTWPQSVTVKPVTLPRAS